MNLANRAAERKKSDQAIVLSEKQINVDEYNLKWQTQKYCEIHTHLNGYKIFLLD